MQRFPETFFNIARNILQGWTRGAILLRACCSNITYFSLLNAYSTISLQLMPINLDVLAVSSINTASKSYLSRLWLSFTFVPVALKKVGKVNLESIAIIIIYYVY